MAAIRTWIHAKLILPAQSLTPSQVGLTTAVGVYGGIFPIPACSTFAALALCSVIFRSSFNPTMTTLALSLNLAATPFQLMMMPVFMDMPSRLWSGPKCDVSGLLTSVRENPISETVSTFGSCLVWATLVWLLFAPIFILVVRHLIAFVIGIRKVKH